MPTIATAIAFEGLDCTDSYWGASEILMFFTGAPFFMKRVPRRG